MKENSPDCSEGNQSLNLKCLLPAGAGQSTGDVSEGLGSTGRPLSAVARQEWYLGSNDWVRSGHCSHPPPASPAAASHSAASHRVCDPLGLQVCLLKSRAATYKAPKNELCSEILNTVIHRSKVNGNLKSLRKQKAS